MSSKSEEVMDINAFNKRNTSSNSPLSVKVKDIQGNLKENNGTPGSFQINMITKERTKKIGKKYQLISFFTGRLD